ncbi:molybdopterin-containing oxidoreductase family protein [Desulfotignum balticum]|uniref:molybdopterin-containing oxidoreductase family protein n=1 Tax=Desulfotignum balticum TaxID=115781 RepID=UPI0004214FE9|nr:molybdopterin-dependent oxidoreductase [Desulfotignum balticum]
MTRTVPVSCPMDCFDLCRFLVTVSDNRIMDIKGDPAHPLTRGIICSKGRDLIQRHSHPERLQHPMVRKKSGFVRTTYNEVLDLVATTLTSVHERWGPAGVLNYVSDGYGGAKSRVQSIFFNCLGGDTRFTGSLCWGAGMAAQTFDFGDVRGHLPEDILNSDLVIVWGRNPKATSLHFYTLLKQAEKNNTRIVVIDPIQSDTAKSLGTHVALKPGTDAALALSMAHVTVTENRYDRSFVQDHILGFDRFCQYLDRFDPETASRITGVSPDTIRKLAREYAAARAPGIWMGYGLQRYASGGNTVRCIDALAAVCGHVGKPGTGANYAARSLAPLLNRPEKNSKAHVTASRTFPAPMLGHFLQTVDNPPIAAAFVAGGNPLNQSPDLNAAVRGFQRIAFKVVFDHFMTDTARHADLVLPAATVFEQDDLFATSMYSHVLNYSKKVVDPPDTLMPETDFFLALAKHMGIDTLGFASSREYLDQCAAPLLESLGKDSDMDLDTLAGEYLRIPGHDIPWADKRFATPSQKIEIFSRAAESAGQSPLPCFINPSKGEDRFPLRLLTCKTKRSMHSQAFVFEDRKPAVSVNRKTAQNFGIFGLERVCIATRQGEVTARLILDEAVCDGTAFMHQGWWHKSGAVNFLTHAGLSDMGEQAAFYDTFCTLSSI